MSNPMADFISDEQPVDKIVVTGTMDCAHCYKTVYEGTFNEEDGMLTFECPNGHVNKVKLDSE